MTRKKILLTFDYELFFGTPSGTAEKCLLSPTRRICDIVNRYGQKAIFFVDTLYLEKVREIGDLETYEKIERQLREIVSNGHRIELHLHPHWLDAQWRDGAWFFPTYRYYRLHALPKEKIVQLFVSGKTLLEEIASKVDPAYSVAAFRAGGWSVEPFLTLKEAFIESGIYIDSSVGYGMRLEGVAHRFDFTDAPDKAFYRFEDSVLQESAQGRFLEVPITTYRTNILQKIVRRVRRKLQPERYRMFGDGKSVGGLRRNYLDEISTYEMLTLESTLPRQLLRRIDRAPFEIVTLISHPKGMSEVAMETLEALCRSPHECIGYEVL